MPTADLRRIRNFGIVAHICFLPQFRGRGLVRRQIEEVLRRFEALKIRTARVSTTDHWFFVPAQRMYVACGFREVRRVPWDRDPSLMTIEYEKEIGRSRNP